MVIFFVFGILYGQWGVKLKRSLCDVFICVCAK